MHYDSSNFTKNQKKMQKFHAHTRDWKTLTERSNMSLYSTVERDTWILKIKFMSSVLQYLQNKMSLKLMKMKINFDFIKFQYFTSVSLIWEGRTTSLNFHAHSRLFVFKRKWCRRFHFSFFLRVRYLILDPGSRFWR